MLDVADRVSKEITQEWLFGERQRQRISDFGRSRSRSGEPGRGDRNPVAPLLVHELQVNRIKRAEVAQDVRFCEAYFFGDRGQRDVADSPPQRESSRRRQNRFAPLLLLRRCSSALECPGLIDPCHFDKHRTPHGPALPHSRDRAGASSSPRISPSWTSRSCPTRGSTDCRIPTEQKLRVAVPGVRTRVLRNERGHLGGGRPLLQSHERGHRVGVTGVGVKQRRAPMTRARALRCRDAPGSRSQHGC